MDRCSALANATIPGSNLTWTDVGATAMKSITTSESYLRPDKGGALLPWIQVWCIATTFFSIIVYIQAFISTGCEPAEILVWTPVILVIDAGSMAQVFFLVIEAKKVRIGDRIVLVESEGEAADANATDGPAPPHESALQESSSLLARYRSFRDRPRALPAAAPVELAAQAPAPGPAAQDNKDDDARALVSPIDPTPPVAPPPPAPRINTLRWHRDPAMYAAASAAALFLAVVVLQVMGLVRAAQAVAVTSEPPPVAWCSPLFQPFGLAVLDGDCHVYAVTQAVNKGIGCIRLPGLWQRQWLTGTVVATVLELVVELGDVLVLALVSGSQRWNGIKLKRPWLTIFSGVIVLLVTLFYGFNYAAGLPPKITERVTVAMNAQGPAAYTGTLTNAGLRGTIIGWNDGLFESWAGAYLGSSH